MKRLFIVIVVIITFGFSLAGCSLFSGNSNIQTGRPRSEKPGTKPPVDEKCRYSVIQKTDTYPEVFNLVPTELYTYEYEVANLNKSGTLDFKCTMGGHIKSITPSAFKVDFGKKQIIKAEFLIPAGTSPGTNIKYLFSVSPNCNVSLQNISFTLTSVPPYEYKLVYPPVTEIKKEPIPSVTYTYEMINHFKNNNKLYEIVLTTLSGPKVGFMENNIMIKGGETKKFYATFFLLADAKIGDLIEYKFKIAFGYRDANYKFIQVGSEKIESYTLKVTQ